MEKRERDRGLPIYLFVYENTTGICNNVFVGTENEEKEWRGQELNKNPPIELFDRTLLPDQSTIRFLLDNKIDVSGMSWNNSRLWFNQLLRFIYHLGYSKGVSET